MRISVTAPDAPGEASRPHYTGGRRVGRVAATQPESRQANVSRQLIDRRPECINVGCWNMRAKFSDERVLDAMTGGSLEVLLLSDPRLSGEPLPQGEAIEYTLTSQSRASSRIKTHVLRSTKVGLACRGKILQYQLLASERVLWADCRIRKKIYRLISVYVPPAIQRHRALAEEVFREVSDLVAATSSSKTLILGGDWNARAGFQRRTGTEREYGNHTYGGLNMNSPLLQELLTNSALCLPASFERRPWRKRWSWRHPKGNTFELDHFLCRQKERYIFCKIRARGDFAGKSDHRILVAKIALYQRRRFSPDQSVDPVRSLALCQDPETLNSFKERLGKLLEVQVDVANTLANTPQGYLEAGISIIRKEALATFPKKMENPPWLSEEYFAAKADLASFEASLQGRRITKQLSPILKAKRRKCEKLCRRDRRRRDNAIIKELEETRERNGLLFRAATSLNKRCEVFSTWKRTPLVVNGFALRSGIETAEAHADALEQRWSAPTAEYPPPQIRNPATREQAFAPPTLQEVVTAIHSLKKGKAAGPDGVPAELLQIGGELTAEWLHRLYTSFWDDPLNTYPEGLSESVIVMIGKPGKDLSKPENYRPIALLPTALKVLEKIILARMQETLEKRLFRCQAGFVRSRQMSEHSLTLRILAEQALANRDWFVGVFIDIKAAYDHVPRAKLLQILGHHGVPQGLLDLLNAMYSRSSFRVRHGTDTSSKRYIAKGLPQGSLLSPLLFNLFMQGLLDEYIQELDRNGLRGILRRKAVNDGNVHWPPRPDPGGELFGIRILVYADDITLLANSQPEAAGMAKLLHTIGLRYGLTLSPSKSSWAHFGSTDPQATTPLYLGDRGEPHDPNLEIPFSENIKYLGKIFDQTADEDALLNARVKAAWKCFFKNKRVLTKKSLSSGIRLRYANATVMATLYFGLETLTLKASSVSRIARFERALLRKVLVIPWRRDMPPSIVRETAARALKQEIWAPQKTRMRRLQLIGHILRSDTICRDLLFSTGLGLRKGKRKSYLNQITEDLRHAVLQSGASNAMELASDRLNYRQACYNYVKSHGDNGRFVCPVCQKDYVYVASFNKHLLLHTDSILV